MQVHPHHQCGRRHPERSDPAAPGRNHFWISLADSDILLWAQGVAVHSGMDVTIGEPDVSPLQLQGPKSGLIMQALFGDAIMDLKYYWLREVELDGIPLIVSRTGWSSELGYELYLRECFTRRRAVGKDHGCGRTFRPEARVTPRRSGASKGPCCPTMPMRTSTPTRSSSDWTGW
jgi:hypothetical protein